MPVYVSFGSLPSNASLRTTGYLPTFVGSIIPASDMVTDAAKVTQADGSEC